MDPGKWRRCLIRATPPIVALTAICVVQTQAQDQNAGLANACVLEPGRTLSVASVENSETLRLADGRIVRLLGTLGPRPPLAAKQTTHWAAENAARDALRTLVAGRDVMLAFDQRKRDRYGRTLAHVFVWHNGHRFWVQGELLAHGHARAYVLPGNTACVAELLANERRARLARSGLWRRRHYRILKPSPAGWLLVKRRHQFSVVEGRIKNVAVVKSRFYLNFGSNWRDDFTAGLNKKSLRGTTTTVAQLLALKGRRVRVRGWIERRNGPYIIVAHPALIETLDTPRSPVPKRRPRRQPEMASKDNLNSPPWQEMRRPQQPRLRPRTKKRPAMSPSPDAHQL